jgi:hypothetical protein
MKETLAQLLDLCVAQRGAEQTEHVLRALLEPPGGPEADRVLTIIANVGVHEIPSEHLRGQVYAASQGNWSAATEEDLRAEVVRILLGVAAKLKERPWQTIYLVPTGHPIVSMQIKTLVYRALRINTIDLAYLNGTYFTVQIDQREIALMATKQMPRPEDPAEAQHPAASDGR